ncbi:hypothetical protein [Pseudoalteromonas luteoviolacea]|uniref:hypothetical protein n=1 Tax=Pseudoalteromonas luteoviolacea TaxID=43657 RepID=UPI001B3A2F9B|nr:hypothetical protein [Pseudoalteromonas luteoviolacea]MBQ4909625.1 hypothetical protein [Pseudoalteromonas luteoviolacea]
MKTISIRCGNITPNSAEVDHDDVIFGWREVESILTNYAIKIDSYRTVYISLNASEVCDRLYWLKPENCEEFFRNLPFDMDNWETEHPFGANVHFSIEKNFDDEKWNEVKFVERVMEQLFLVLNVAVRGGCNFGSIQIGDSWKSLHCSNIESGWHYSSINSWPLIQPIPVAKSWYWFEKHSSLFFNLANTSITKASAVLLHLSYKGDIESTDVLQLSQVMENFYLNKGEPKARGLNRKIAVVLGHLPHANKGLIQDFYKLRSVIAHGDFPLFRPRYDETDLGFKEAEQHYWDISNEIDKGVAILIGTLQFLIENDASSMSFYESISVETNG